MFAFLLGLLCGLFGFGSGFFCRLLCLGGRLTRLLLGVLDRVARSAEGGRAVSFGGAGGRGGRGMRLPFFTEMSPLARGDAEEPPLPVVPLMVFFCIPPSRAADLREVTLDVAVVRRTGRRSWSARER